MLKDRVYIVTGSSSGIGLGIARALAAEGAKPVLHGAHPEKVAAATRSLAGAPGVLADLADPAAAQNIVDFAVETHGRLDGLVNNAGMFPRSDIDTTDAAMFDRIMAVNARAPLLLTQAAVRRFRQQKSAGAIVNIGSLNAHCGQTDLLAYSMSKGAMMTMTRNLGDALGPEKIRVNQLNVGWTLTDTEIETQRQQGRPGDWMSRLPRDYAPSGGLLTPETVAQHVLFWLSDKSIPISGQVYEVEQYPVIGRNLLNRTKT